MRDRKNESVTEREREKRDRSRREKRTILTGLTVFINQVGFRNQIGQF